MSVLNREEFMNRINAYVGEDTSDEALSFIGDMSDTYDELNKGSGEWESKYKNLDAEWRKKYKERFLTGSPEGDDKNDEQVRQDDRATSIGFADLFN